MSQVGEKAGIFGGEGERIEVPFEAHDAERAKDTFAIFRIASFKTVNRGHGVRRRAESHVPDHQLIRRCLEQA